MLRPVRSGQPIDLATSGEIAFDGSTAELKADAAFIQHHLGV